MDKERFQRVKEIFKAVVKLDPGERAAYLDDACSGDLRLRAEVESLLESGGETDDFLETPPFAFPTAAATGEDLVGIRIGRYVVKRLISSGGMGTVYEALQDDPRRVVALKVMKRGLLSESAQRRFSFEAQILARLRHPNIAQVIEAGTFGGDGDSPAGAGGGTPYFVMEYIPDASSLTDYAREKQLTTGERLGLFIQVCDAVHHGHQRGIIHRDLKPGNILVESQGQVKIIDFGVARVTDADIALTTFHTEAGQLIGTMQYMSPEQMKADPDALDIRSDVYALGVVLYELLCGELPYDVRHAAVLEAARLIGEMPPRRPSTVDRRLRGDAETIVLKALEKEQRRRYQSASDLSDDIRRFLRGDVIQARRASAATKTWKLIKRNPVLSSAVGAASLCLLAFLFYVVLWSYPRLQREKDKLEQEMVNTVMINDFLEEMITWADPFKEGREITLAEMLDRAAQKIETRFPDRPEIEASLRHTLGTTYMNKGVYGAAQEQLEHALDLRREVLGKNDPETLATIDTLARLCGRQGRYEEAESLFDEALSGRQRVLGAGHPQTLASTINRAELFVDQGRHDEAEVLYVEGLERLRLELGEDNPATVAAMKGLAKLYWAQGRYEDAESLLLDTLSVAERVQGAAHPSTLSIRNSLASLYFSQSRYDEAEPFFLKVLGGERRVLGDGHPSTLTTMNNLATLYRHKGRYDESEKLYTETLDGRQRVLGDGHPDTLLAMNNLALLRQDQGRFQDAEDLFSKALGAERSALGNEHPQTLITMVNLAVLYKDRDKHEKAEPLFLEALDGRRRVSGDEHPETLAVMTNLASFYRLQGRSEEAEPLLVEALEKGRRILGADHLKTLAILDTLAGVYQGQG